MTPDEDTLEANDNPYGSKFRAVRQSFRIIVRHKKVRFYFFLKIDMLYYYMSQASQSGSYPH